MLNEILIAQIYYYTFSREYKFKYYNFESSHTEQKWFCKFRFGFFVKKSNEDVPLVLLSNLGRQAVTRRVIFIL